jgi:hypothetical protein
MGQVGFVAGRSVGKAIENRFPERATLGIVGDSGPGDVSENPFGFFHHGESNEFQRIHSRRTGKLTGTADGDGVVGVFSNDEKNR